jgi:hypothetical protein
MAIEDPHQLLGRLKLGREEYCQRLLTMLILDGAYPRWNTPNTASPDGLRFLGLLEELSLGEPRAWTDPVFVDELDLPKRTEWEQGGAPDQSLHDHSRLWMIELKTEAGSHRPTQIPLSFELGRHHYPHHRIDITYLTGPLSKGAPPIPDGCRFGHVTWSEVMPLIRDVWADHSPTHREVVRTLDDVLEVSLRNGRLGEQTASKPGPLSSFSHRTPPATQLSSLVLRRSITSSALSTSPRPTWRTFRRFDSRCFIASQPPATRRCCTSVHGYGAGQARDNH